MGDPRPPHHGAIVPECPVECLLSVLSQQTWSPLARGDSFFSQPPKTVGDVLAIQARGELWHIRALGATRVRQIEKALIEAGFDIVPSSENVRSPHHVDEGAETPEEDEHERPASAKPTTACPVCGTPAPFPPAEPDDPRGFPLPQPVAKNSTTERAIAYLAANCHRTDLQAPDIAAALGISVRALQSSFQRHVGRSPMQLMADMRLHRVHQALVGQGPEIASIREAAQLAGYGGRVERFRKAYSDRYGREPSLPGTAGHRTKVPLHPLAEAGEGEPPLDHGAGQPGRQAGEA